MVELAVFVTELAPVVDVALVTPPAPEVALVDVVAPVCVTNWGDIMVNPKKTTTAITTTDRAMAVVPIAALRTKMP